MLTLHILINICVSLCPHLISLIGLTAVPFRYCLSNTYDLHVSELRDLLILCKVIDRAQQILFSFSKDTEHFGKYKVVTYRKWNLHRCNWLLRPGGCFSSLVPLQVCVDNVLKTMKENANKASSILLTAIPQISQMDWAQTMKTLKVSYRLYDDSFPFSESLKKCWKKVCLPL